MNKRRNLQARPDAASDEKSMFEGLGVAVLVVDPATTAILEANSAACAFYGYAHPDLTRLKILDLATLPPEEVRARAHKIATGELSYMRLAHRLANGEIRDVEVYLGRGTIKGQAVIVATVLDITARKRAEAQLQESETRYHALFDTMREGFSLNEIIQDEQGEVIDFLCLDANAAYEYHTGQTRAEAIGRTIRACMPEVDSAMIRRYGQVALTGEPFITEYYSNTFNRYMRIHAFCPQPRRFAVIFEDVSAWRESEARYATVFQTNHDALSIMRLADGVYLDVNEAFCSVIGIPREQVLGHTRQELNIQDDLVKREEFLTLLRAQGRVVNFETSVQNALGQTEYLLVSGALTEIGGQACVVVSGKIITFRKQAELAEQAARDQLAQLNAELTRSNQDLEQFAYAASHDLQEPLRHTMLFAQMIARHLEGHLDDELKTYLTYINESTHRMSEMIKGLLNYSRLNRGEYPFGPVACQLLLEKVQALLALQIQETQAEVKVAPLPVVTGNEILLTHLFQNLLGNALKFHGARPPQVQICARQSASAMWEFRVQDHGIGIAPEYFERVFGPFQRLHTHTEYEGVGIGLALCKRIVEQHGGQIWIESQIGEGTTFIFTLPTEDTSAST